MDWKTCVCIVLVIASISSCVAVESHYNYLEEKANIDAGHIRNEWGNWEVSK